MPAQRRKRKRSAAAQASSSKKPNIQKAGRLQRVVDLTLEDNRDHQGGNNDDEVTSSQAGVAGTSSTIQPTISSSAVEGATSDEALARILQSEEWGVAEDALEDFAKQEVAGSQENTTNLSRGSPQLRSTPASQFSIPSARAGKTDGPLSTQPECELSLELRAHEAIFHEGQNCPQCAEPLALIKESVKYTSTCPPPALIGRLHLVCATCKASYCRGCYRSVNCGIECSGALQNCEVMGCCAAVRATGLFEALVALDKAHLLRKSSSNAGSQSSLAVVIKDAAKGPRSSGVGSGIGYALEDEYGDGFDDYDEDDEDDDDDDVWQHYNNGHYHRKKRSGPLDTTSMQKANAEAKAWDSLVKAALETTMLFLPNPYHNDPKPFDLLPHPSIRAMLLMSHLPEIIAELLRNDSITDWTARSQLYNALLSLLRRLADSELGVGLLIEGRMAKKRSDGLGAWMQRSGEIEWEIRTEGNASNAGTSSEASTTATRIVFVKDPPLYDYFKKLTRQCEAFMAGAAHLLDGIASDDEGDGAGSGDNIISSIGICTAILSTRDDIDRAVSAWRRGGGGQVVDGGDDIEGHLDKVTDGAKTLQVDKKGKGKARTPTKTLQAGLTYAAACEKLAFAFVELPRVPANLSSATGDPAIQHYVYARDISATSLSTRIPRQRLHLVKELGVMSTSLPIGIWVRVDEVRNDAIKAMIAGPEGTPYEGGLFEFDCFIPLDYPNSPPKVNIHTTAGGQVRFNPNLYADGKVCLSLLGTWEGRPEEQWSPTSTILQVLVSIQSMIFNETPFFNEPGYGRADATDRRSIAYNKQVVLQNVRWAMVDWMKEEQQHGLWADVIKAHFTINRDLIRKRIASWAKADARFKAYHSSTMSLCGREGDGGGRAPKQSEPGLNLVQAFEAGCGIIDTWNYTFEVLE
ncbi:hypothetical protein BOTBODRAFT_137755 [Botryobasidium botryosum FD-172 SS1]|uniref:UBC core domain-containing protein n=1 Tax=Botryobasidium botryosum (strain FD-172 SS1) TaxID=930990 RepID=A0A067MC41_BOTB1|nr:hypothetical protein BOTBODRAFT_137755 [Botryobasidium botryosum FD-172 SS1]